MQNREIQENKGLIMDENGNKTVHHNTEAIYYVTAKITKEPPEQTTDQTVASQSPQSQVSHVKSFEKSQNKLQLSSDGLSAVPGHVLDNIWMLPSNPPSRPLACSSSTNTKKYDSSCPKQGAFNVLKIPCTSPTAICAPVPLTGPDIIKANMPANQGELMSANHQQVFRLAKAWESSYAEVEHGSETFLIPDTPGEEPSPPSPPDNIAFMITNTKVQALSTREYQELVKAKKGNVQTVTVGSKPHPKHGIDAAG